VCNWNALRRCEDIRVHIKPEFRKKEFINSGLNYNNLGILKLIKLIVTLPLRAGEMSWIRPDNFPWTFHKYISTQGAYYK